MPNVSVMNCWVIAQFVLNAILLLQFPNFSGLGLVAKSGDEVRKCLREQPAREPRPTCAHFNIWINGPLTTTSASSTIRLIRRGFPLL